MIEVTIKTQSTGDFHKIEEFSANFSDETKLKEVTKWIDLMITDKFTVMGTSIKLINNKG